MPVRMRRARESTNTPGPKGAVQQDDRLALVDQAFFAGHQAAGQKDVMQVVWLYEHPINWDGLRRFHHNLGRGLLGRRIERSPLPFARYRWVVDHGPSDIDIEERARPRAELSDWADERSQLPTDPEWGPGWHLGVLPLTDGSTAVSLVASHYLLDGIGLVVALVDALSGNTRDLGYRPPQSRTRLRAMVEDARRTARDVPGVARALAAAPKQVRLRPPVGAPAPTPRPVAIRHSDGDEPVVVPGVSIYVDIDAFDARAESLGGSGNTLVAGMAAKFGELMGHEHDHDGNVTVQLVMSDRTEGDTRAVAVSLARIQVDPTWVTTDLRDTRAAVKEALTTWRETPHVSSHLESLTPFMPKRTWKWAVDRSFADPDRPVVCSNLGDVGMVVNRLDGSDAEYAFARGTRQHVTRRWLERIGGQLQLLSFRIPGRVVVHVLGYQLGAENSKPALRELAARVLDEFDLTGQVD
ncbi:hypothetical protein A5658_19670 [Mycobacterium sp. 1245111.1]|uniref:hypothetical protein n=1 Tax=Mycobacterium sp. 1245111.1 TaxID=1834073 RepID=UPI0007FF4774|nr:hypothetical protein [Mycobacterium sp. 1245111.1]OBK40984.1 hypothetical protein A5658_19670 [Mycobacterium sp. 1245111.1]